MDPLSWLEKHRPSVYRDFIAYEGSLKASPRPQRTQRPPAPRPVSRVDLRPAFVRDRSPASLPCAQPSPATPRDRSRSPARPTPSLQCAQRSRSPLESLSPASSVPRDRSRSPPYFKEIDSPQSPDPEMECDPTPSVSVPDDDEGFTQVISKKAKKRAAASSPNKPAKAPCPPSGTLPPSSAGDSDSESPSQTPRSSSKLPPPFLVHDKDRWTELFPSFAGLGIELKSANNTQMGIKVQVASIDSHRALTSVLRAKAIGYHTYALESEKHLRVVIRGVPKELPCELISEDLKSQGFPVREVHRLYGRNKVCYDLVLVILDKSPSGKAIFNLKKVCNLSGLSVETPHKNGTPAQCHRCQFYGHSARFCNARPRCVKCLGDHSTSECSRKRDDPTLPSCVLCGTEGHTANYRGCSKAPKSKGPQKRPQRFVPAPIPKGNAWLSKGRSAPAPAMPAPIPAPAKPAPIPAPVKPAPIRAPLAPPPLMATPVLPPVSHAIPAMDNLSLVIDCLSVVDFDALAILADKFRVALRQRNTNAFLTAVIEHYDVVAPVHNFVSQYGLYAQKD